MNLLIREQRGTRGLLFSLAQNSIKIAVTPADPNFLAAFTSLGMSPYVSTAAQ
ncbi:MAG: hypothetical protein IPG90_03955 [Bacteroidetes bacterium]|nr:hypothetical protein [Bacteroidota bacterium]